LYRAGRYIVGTATKRHYMPALDLRSQEHPVARRWACLAAMEPFGEVTSFHRGEEIYAQRDPAQHWYRVLGGMARKFAITAGGERQIVDFLLPNDFFGFTAHDKRAFSVEAVTEGTVVARYPRHRVEAVADCDPRVGRLIRETAFQALSRMQARMLILGRTTAAEKVSAFLAEMADRSGDRPAESFVLPMSRYDIADYLALSVETVSRALTELQHRGAIVLVSTHRVKIVKRAAFRVVSDDVAAD
jgi:CRP/FNR family transcriptional regulator, nitrogen fixation regulation protein